MVERLLQHAVSVDLHGMRSRGQRRGSVVPKIKTSYRRRLLRAPGADAELAILTLAGLRASGHQAQPAWPVHGQFIIGEIRGVAEVWIPAFTRGNVEHAGC